MSSTFKIACAQTTTGPEVAGNIVQATDLIRRARDAGADFIGLPEVVNVMDLATYCTLIAAVAELRLPASVPTDGAPVKEPLNEWL